MRRPKLRKELSLACHQFGSLLALVLPIPPNFPVDITSSWKWLSLLEKIVEASVSEDKEPCLPRPALSEMTIREQVQPDCTPAQDALRKLLQGQQSEGRIHQPEAGQGCPRSPSPAYKDEV